MQSYVPVAVEVIQPSLVAEPRRTDLGQDINPGITETYVRWRQKVRGRIPQDPEYFPS